MLLRYSRRLIRSPTEEVKYSQTHIGQASWAIGPKTCGECVFFCDETSTTGLCAKYEHLMGCDGIRFPGSARACRFYTPSAAVESEPAPEAA